MPPFGPVKRRELVACLRRAGFDGPFSGGKHSVMKRDDSYVILPNPHRGDIGRDLLARLLSQAGLSREEWERL